MQTTDEQLVALAALRNGRLTTEEALTRVEVPRF